ILAMLTILSVVTVAARFRYAGNIAVAPKDLQGHLPPAFWWYAGAAALIGFGFADYPLIAFHYAKTATVSAEAIPIFYAAAMGASGVGSLVFGRWFDARGLGVLIPGVILSAFVAPLVFFGGFALALTGTILWGIALGVHD